MKKIITYLLVMLIAFKLPAQNTISPKARDIVSKMTLEEKAKLVVGNGFQATWSFPTGTHNRPNTG